LDELDVRLANHTGGHTSRRTLPSPLAASAQIAAALLAVLDVGEEVPYPRPGPSRRGSPSVALTSSAHS